MRAKLSSGAIIELVKDCTCVTHFGPHWLHLDDLWKARNTELLVCGSIQGHIVEELARLDSKLHEMTSRGIEEVYREEA